MNTYINRYIISTKNIIKHLCDKKIKDENYTCNFFKQCSNSISFFENINDDMLNNLIRISFEDKINHKEILTVLKSDYLFHESIFKTNFNDEMKEFKVNAEEIFKLENIFISGNIIINSLQIREGIIVNGFDVNFIVDNEPSGYL